MAILNFDDNTAWTVFWHFSTHLLGQSLEHNYDVLLTIDLPIARGFYYNSHLGNTGLSKT